MNQVTISIKVESFKVNSNGLTTADINFNIDDHAFPMNGWNDFAIIILEWWVTATFKLFRNTSTKEVLHFMDGPYAVKISKISPDLLNFCTVEAAGRSKKIITGEMETISFAHELISQSHRALDACKKADLWTRDSDTLESSVAALETEISGSQ